MTWRVIYTGATVLLLAIFVGLLAIIIRDENPWLFNVAVVADMGVIVAGLKAVLDTTKTANELRKMGFEVEKLKLEIDEKKKAAEKQDSRIVVATLDEIQIYSRRINPQSALSKTASRSGSALYIGTTALMLTVVAGFVLRSRPATAPQESARELGQPSVSNPNTGKLSPSTPHDLDSDELVKRLDNLNARALAVDRSLEAMRKNLKTQNLILRTDIVRKQVDMGDRLWRATRAHALGDDKRAADLASRGEVFLKELEDYLSRSESGQDQLK
jgi:hypothetical protein